MCEVCNILLNINNFYCDNIFFFWFHHFWYLYLIFSLFIVVPFDFICFDWCVFRVGFTWESGRKQMTRQIRPADSVLRRLVFFFKKLCLNEDFDYIIIRNHVNHGLNQYQSWLQSIDQINSPLVHPICHLKAYCTGLSQFPDYHCHQENQMQLTLSSSIWEVIVVGYHNFDHCQV